MENELTAAGVSRCEQKIICGLPLTELESKSLIALAREALAGREELIELVNLACDSVCSSVISFDRAKQAIQDTGDRLSELAASLHLAEAVAEAADRHNRALDSMDPDASNWDEVEAVLEPWNAAKAKGEA